MKIKKLMIFLLLTTFSFSFSFVAACNFGVGDSISEESGLENDQDSGEDINNNDDENFDSEDEIWVDEKPNDDDNSSIDGEEDCGEDDAQTKVYQIYDYYDLNQLSENIKSAENVVVELKNDIDCNYHFVNMIGDYNNPFSGEFNGNGFTISNIYFDSQSALKANNNTLSGMFGIVENANIHNITFENCMFDLQGNNIVAGLICKSNGGTSIENISICNGSYNIIGENITFGGIVAEDLITSTDKRINLAFEGNMITIESNGGSLFFGTCFGKGNYNYGEISNLIISDNMIFIYDYNYGNLNIGFLIGKLQSEIDKELLINVVYVNNNLFEVEDLGSSNISRYIGNVEGIKKSQIHLNQVTYLDNYFYYNSIDL